MVTQVSRFDRIKDPLGVIDAFRWSRRRERAHLVLAGGSANDDPEGAGAGRGAREGRATEGRHDPGAAPRLRTSRSTRSSARRPSCVQKSLREGFALTVSEALWKRRAVVASAVGGIPLQVLHERTGLLVRSVEGCALQMIRLLRDPRCAAGSA